MSRLATAVQSAAKAVVARVPRLKRFYDERRNPIGKAMDELRQSKWAGYCLVPDLCRISRGTGQAQFLLSVYASTAGRMKNEGGPRRYADAKLPADYAAEGEFTEQQMFQDIRDAIARGLASSKAVDEGHAEPDNPFHFTPAALENPKIDTADLYSFRACLEAWRQIPSVKVAKKPVGSAEESDESEEEEEARPLPASDRLKLNASALRPRLLKPGKSQRFGKMQFRGADLPLEVENTTPQAQVVRFAQTDANGIRVVLEHREGKVQEMRPPAPAPRSAAKPRREPASPTPQSDNSALPALSPSQTNEILRRYERTIDWITDIYDDAEESYLARLIAAAEQAFKDAGGPAEKLNDTVMLEAFQKLERGSQRSAGGFNRRIQAEFSNWGRKLSREAKR